MTRRSRRIRPAFDAFENKTLLSAGHLGHLAGGPAHGVEVRADQYYYRIDIKAAPGYTATNVTWSFYFDGTFIQGSSRPIPSVGQVPVSITTSTAVPRGIGGRFYFDYAYNGIPKQANSDNTGSSTSRNPPGPVTPFILPINTGARRGIDGKTGRFADHR